MCESPQWPALTDCWGALDDPMQKGIPAAHPALQPLVCRGPRATEELAHSKSPNHAWWGPLFCSTGCLALQSLSSWCALQSKQMQPKVPLYLDLIDVPRQGGRAWPTGQPLSSDYSFPTRNSLLGIKNWHVKRRIYQVSTGIWWVYMSALSVLLFDTFTLVYFSSQSAEHAAPTTGSKATTWRVTASPIMLMTAITSSWAGLWKCLERGRTKSIPTGLHRVCPTG